MYFCMAAGHDLNFVEFGGVLHSTRAFYLGCDLSQPNKDLIHDSCETRLGGVRLNRVARYTIADERIEDDKLTLPLCRYR